MVWICPAQAGVIPEQDYQGQPWCDLSRASGGDPRHRINTIINYEFVPRKRG